MFRRDRPRCGAAGCGGPRTGAARPLVSVVAWNCCCCRFITDGWWSQGRFAFITGRRPGRRRGVIARRRSGYRRAVIARRRCGRRRRYARRWRRGGTLPRGRSRRSAALHGLATIHQHAFEIAERDIRGGEKRRHARQERRPIIVRQRVVRIIRPEHHIAHRREGDALRVQHDRRRGWGRRRSGRRRAFRRRGARSQPPGDSKHRDPDGAHFQSPTRMTSPSTSAACSCLRTLFSSARLLIGPTRTRCQTSLSMETR